MPTAPPPPPRDAHDVVSTAPLLQRIGSLLAVGVLASCFAAAPAALRIASDLEGDVAAAGVPMGRVGVLLAVATAWVMPMLVAVETLRHARVGVRAFEGEGRGERATALTAWLATFGLFLAVFGSALRATTHHHALAGATFGIVAAVVGALLGLAARRFARALFDSSDAVRAGGLTILVAVVLVVVGLFAVRLAHATAQGPHGQQDTAELLVDGLAFAIAATLASRPELTRTRALGFAGLPLVVVLLVVGIRELRVAPPLAGALVANAPAAAPIVKLYTEH